MRRRGHSRSRLGPDEFGHGDLQDARRRRRGGRRGRILDHGNLRLVILHLIAERPKHGYDIIKEIEEKIGGIYSPSPGVVYPTLTMLQEQGYTALSNSEGMRKLYAITPEGIAHLEANRSSVDAIFQRIETLRSAQRDPAPPIFRAMENLKLALSLRLKGSPLTETQIHAVAAAIDAAAVAVERT